MLGTPSTFNLAMDLNNIVQTYAIEFTVVFMLHRDVMLSTQRRVNLTPLWSARMLLVTERAGLRAGLRAGQAGGRERNTLGCTQWC